VANLIVAELANRWGAQLAFRSHMRVGVPNMLLTLLVALVLVSTVGSMQKAVGILLPTAFCTLLSAPRPYAARRSR